MLRRLGFLIRRDERRPVAIAFAFLIGLVASHAALETARDGLFLARVPGERLPFVYIAIAVCSFAAQRLQLTIRIRSRRAELALTTAFTGLGTLAFAIVTDGESSFWLYALYVWTGVVTALVLLSFWNVMATVFSATQAKRVYGVVGLGSMVGAVLGTSGVTLLADLVGPRAVVALAGLGFLASATLPRLLPARDAPVEAHATAARAPLLTRLRDNVNYSKRGPYVWRLVGIAVAASVTVTLTDFVFKTAMARAIPPAELTAAFGRTYFVLNALALGVQLLAVGFLIRRLAPATLIALLPMALLASGTLILGTAGLLAALVAKGADSTMRYGLYKTGMELLTLPLSEGGRRRAKAALELVGQRGGQVIASSVILALSALALGPRAAAVALVLAAGLWLVLSFRLHSYYLDQFRFSITAGRDHTRPLLAALDAASLETLIATLDSDSNEEVLAALAVLEQEKKLRLVPVLILFHPDEDVVVAALRAFVRSSRAISLHALDHLLEHASPRVRAEAYPIRFTQHPDADKIKLSLEREGDPSARAAIVSAMVALGELDPERGRTVLAELIACTDVPGKVVVLEAFALRRIPALDDVVHKLANEPEREVKRAAVDALVVMGTAAAARTLVGFLADPGLESAARTALASMGGLGFSALAAALADGALPAAARWAVPRALALVDPVSAGPILLDNLPGERDGMVRYRSIVALTTIVERAPGVRLDQTKLLHELSVNVSRAYRYLDRLAVVQQGARSEPSRKTDGHSLLVQLLEDKQKSAVGRIFRLLAVLFPQHQFGAIYRAIESGERLHRAGAVELTSNLLVSPLREAVVGLVEDMDLDARLALAGSFHERLDESYIDLLRTLLRSRSSIVRDVAAFHIAELGELDLEADLAELEGQAQASDDVTRALAILRGTHSGRSTFLSSAPPSVTRVG